MKMSNRITIKEATADTIEIKIYKDVGREVVENDVAELLSIFDKKVKRYEIFSSVGSIVDDFRAADTAIVWFD